MNKRDLICVKKARSTEVSAPPQPRKQAFPYDWKTSKLIHLIYERDPVSVRRVLWTKSLVNKSTCTTATSETWCLHLIDDPAPSLCVCMCVRTCMCVCKCACSSISVRVFFMCVVLMGFSWLWSMIQLYPCAYVCVYVHARSRIFVRAGVVVYGCVCTKTETGEGLHRKKPENVHEWGQ